MKPSSKPDLEGRKLSPVVHLSGRNKYNVQIHEEYFRRENQEEFQFKLLWVEVNKSSLLILPSTGNEYGNSTP